MEVSPYNAIWWWQQQTLRKLMKNMTRKSWIFWNWQSLPELSDLEKSDLKIRSRSVKKRSTIRSRSWSRKMVKSDLRSDQKVICRSRSWSVDQDRHYFVLLKVWKVLPSMPRMFYPRDLLNSCQIQTLRTSRSLVFDLEFTAWLQK